MARWRKGEAEIERLIAARALERVVADPDIAMELLRIGEKHVASGKLVAPNDLEAGYALAYDGARKAATALLAVQGLRPTSAGGHIAVVDAVRAQFPGAPGLESLDRLRRRRNEAEYPDPRGHAPLTPEEVQDALSVAGQTVESAARLIESSKLGVF